ncbi:MAG: hypothetical protein KKF89_04985, partial [Nanoarchaeota archaeon]|nr:hypothetical protein [Nanoarchaeota archaeon]
MSKFFQIKKKNVFVFFLVLAMFFYIPSFVEARVDCSPAPLGTIGGATSCGFHSDGVIRYDDPHLAASTESIDALVPCSNKCAEDDFGCQWTGTSGNIKCWSTDDFIVGNSCDYSHLWSGDGVVNEHGYCVFPCSDTDGDGYGYPASSLCNYPEGDCDDSDSDINPSASEVCNNIDDDCVNGVDDGLSNCQCTYDAPSDENCDGIDNNCDGVIDSPDCVCGSLDLEFCQCENDAQPTTEVCDNVDNDCDGYIDEYP